jgi:putative acetyltransferase
MESTLVHASEYIVRCAAPKDSEDAARIIRAAFGGSAMGYHGEAELAEQLTVDGDVVLALVAERYGRIIGYAQFSRMTVNADGAEWRAAALAPVAVDPAVQRAGVGAALISAGLEQLHAADFQISFVLGHPGYYPRFGYNAAVAAPFASPYAGPHFMALLLDKSLQIPKSGRADYAAAFSR